MKRIKEHSDKYFIAGFSRYLVLEKINEAVSWKTLEEALGEEDMNMIFEEFKIQNLALTIEYKLVSLLGVLFEGDQLKLESIKSCYWESIRRCQKADSIDEAKQILVDETDSDNSNMFTPHVTFYVAGLSLSGLIGILRDCTKKFVTSAVFLERLTEFGKIRNLVIHNLLTSRENMNSNIQEGIRLSREIIDLIESEIGLAESYVAKDI